VKNANYCWALLRDFFQFVGNAFFQGATLLSFSQDLLGENRLVAKMMTDIELSGTPGYMNQYIAALFISHTQIEYFPTLPEGSRTATG